MDDLWARETGDAWQQALDRYPEVVARQGVSGLQVLDRWYHEDFAGSLRLRPVPHVTREELVRVTEWKMARGVWRARNLRLVSDNPPAVVERVSGEALAEIPHPRAPIARLATLSGVGPATASAVAAAVAPEVFPFFDELVAVQVPGLGPVAFTIPYYLRYAELIRQRARRLGWTPATVERALWANSGGKIALAGPAA